MKLIRHLALAALLPSCALLDSDPVDRVPRVTVLDTGRVFVEITRPLRTEELRYRGKILGRSKTGLRITEVGYEIWGDLDRDGEHDMDESMIGSTYTRTAGIGSFELPFSIEVVNDARLIAGQIHVVVGGDRQSVPVRFELLDS